MKTNPYICKKCGIRNYSMRNRLCNECAVPPCKKCGAYTFINQHTKLCKDCSIKAIKVSTPRYIVNHWNQEVRRVWAVRLWALFIALCFFVWRHTAWRESIGKVGPNWQLVGCAGLIAIGLLFTYKAICSFYPKGEWK